MTGESRIAAPWVRYYREIEAMFAKDPDVAVIYDNNIPEVKLLVETDEKADALAKLLPPVKDFGNINLMITVVPANKPDFPKIELFRKAFKGNAALRDIEIVDGPISNPINFVVFAKEVVQYFVDDAGDLHGLHSTLYEDMARELFSEHEGIFFCTDNE